MLTTWILTDEAGRLNAPLGEWVEDMRKKLSLIQEVVNLKELQDKEVIQVLSRHGVELMLSDDYQKPTKSDYLPSRPPPQDKS